MMKNKLKVITFLFFICFFLGTVHQKVNAQEQAFGAYKIEEFDFQGRNAKIVFPNLVNASRKWVWRARFWGAEPQVDKALLDKGYHLVYVDVAGLYGNQKAVQVWNDFYKFIKKKYELNSKAVLEGLSRGGLIIYNWAAQNTDKVACIYADAPVCDIKSWPGGLYTGIGSPKDWKECLNAYGLDEQSVMDFSEFPVNTSIKVAQAKIPVIHVYGDNDKVVPHFENTERLAINFVLAGGNIKIIRKKGIGHHPHSLENPTPIVDFILEHSLYAN